MTGASSNRVTATGRLFSGGTAGEDFAAEFSAWAGTTPVAACAAAAVGWNRKAASAKAMATQRTACAAVMPRVAPTFDTRINTPLRPRAGRLGVTSRRHALKD